MNSGTENRKSLRQAHDVKFICKFSETGDYDAVRVKNYSTDGLYFESLRAFEPGKNVLLYSRGGDFPELSDHSDFREYRAMAHAQIRWCAPVKGRVKKFYGGGQRKYFGAGAEYTEV